MNRATGYPQVVVLEPRNLATRIVDELSATYQRVSAPPQTTNRRSVIPGQRGSDLKPEIDGSVLPVPARTRAMLD
jgi:hypothetical protein